MVMATWPTAYGRAGLAAARLSRRRSARGEDGFGITVSTVGDEASIANWKKNAEHQLARVNGHERW